MLSIYAGLSLGVSALILLMIALKPLLKKRYSARWGYLAWILLCVCLVIPFGDMLPKVLHQYVIAVPDKTIETIDFSPVFGGERMQTEPYANRQEIAQAEPTGTYQNANAEPSGNSSAEAKPADSTPKTVETAAPTVQTTRIDLWSAVNLFWLLGIAVFLLYYGISYLAFQLQFRNVKTEQPDEETEEIYRKAEDAVRAKRKAELLIAEGLPSPMLAGFLRPKIYLPKESVGCPGLEMIFRHELVHLKRGDLYVKLLAVAANAIHWFNPLAYSLRRRMDVDCEFSCDERVLRGETIENRVCYGEAVLSVMRGAVRQKTVFTTNFTSGKGTVKMRLRNILDGKTKKSGILTLIALFLVTAVISSVIVFADDAKQATFFGTIKVPSSITKIDQKTYSLDLYIGDKLAGGAKTEEYNVRDPNGLTIPEDFVEDDRTESTVNGFPAYTCMLTSLSTDETEHHVYVVDKENRVVFEFYGIDAVASSDLAGQLVKSWSYSAPDPSALWEGYTWKLMSYEDHATYYDEGERLSDTGKMLFGVNASSSCVKAAVQLAKQHYQDAGISARYEGYSYNSRPVLNAFGVEQSGYVTRVYFDSNRCVEVCETTLWHFTAGTITQYAVGYKEIQPMETLPDLKALTLKEAKTSAIYREGTKGDAQNYEKAEEFVNDKENGTPAKLDLAVFNSGKLTSWCRLVYDGEKLYEESLVERPEGGYNVYKDMDLKDITVEGKNINTLMVATLLNECQSSVRITIYGGTYYLWYS